MKTQKRKEMKFVGEFPKSEFVLGLSEFQNKIYVATNKAVYEIREGKLLKLEISCKG